MVWEQRWHPLRREWVIVSSHRNDSGRRNERYSGVYVFDNDHPCVAFTAPVPPPAPPDGIYRISPAHGVSRVVCYSPRHDLTLAQLPESEVLGLLQALQAQYRELGAQPGVRHVLVFENKGEVVGVSNPHPHCQIYATNFVFKTIESEAEAQATYLAEHGRPLFQEIIQAEETDGRRLIARREMVLAVIPYFARYPYETFVAPRTTRASLADLTAQEVRDFAAVLRETLIRLDNLWRMSFPYVMVLHQAPTDRPYPGFHFHIEIHPPLRKPGLLKYLAGPEIGGGNFLNDTAPEEKAAELQAVSNVHYTEGGEGAA